MKKGIIYNLVSQVIQLLTYLNLVEILKYVIKYFFGSSYSRLTVDIYIIMKFVSILVLWNLKIQSHIAEIFVWYLIISTLYTYFYYHLWKEKSENSFDSQKRRFLNVFISLLFTSISFAYLYSECYVDEFVLTSGFFKEQSAFLYSAFNSIFGSYEPFKPKTDFGYFITFNQLLISFIYLSIILANSFPNSTNNE